ncbi:MAG TPA: ankyrin repeat domain-containing protein [Capsulimonadaceae bacterium]|jgi:ankyrin repeat protein
MDKSFRELLDECRSENVQLNRERMAQRVANINNNDLARQYLTTIHKSIVRDDPDKLRSLLERGCDPDMCDADGAPALFTAIVYDRADAVDILLDAGADINARNQRGDIALRSALFQRRDALAQRLLTRGADIGSDEAAMLADAPLLDSMLSQLADTDRSDAASSAVRYAAFAGSLACIDVALKHGGTLDEADPQGRTALMMASLNHTSRPRNEMVKWLLDNGANVNANTTIGLTALGFAAMKGYTDTAELLIYSGADIGTAPGEPGNRALMCAIQTGSTDIVKLLISRGVDPSGEDQNGNSPRKIAELRNTPPELLNLLPTAKPSERQSEAVSPTSPTYAIPPVFGLWQKVRDAGLQFQHIDVSVETRVKLLRVYRRIARVMPKLSISGGEPDAALSEDLARLLDAEPGYRPEGLGVLLCGEGQNIITTETRKSRELDYRRLDAIRLRQSPDRDYAAEIEQAVAESNRAMAEAIDDGTVARWHDASKRCNALWNEASAALGICDEMVYFGVDAVELADDSWE